MEADEYRLLDALRQGLPIGEALEKMAQGSAIAEERLGAAVQEWFAGWARMGWLCAAAATNAGQPTQPASRVR